MHGMATYGMSCFGLCLYSFRPHQHHLVAVWRLRHLAFCGSDDSESAIVCSVPAEIRFIGQGSLLLGCFPPAFLGNVKIFEESAFFSRCVWWSFPPDFFTNHFYAQCAPAFPVFRVLYLFSGAHSYAFLYLSLIHI